MPVITDQPVEGWFDPHTNTWIPNITQGQEIPPPATVREEEPAPTPSAGSTWKPDFTADDPWKDMPKDYSGIATFVPTESNPTPPWETPTTKAGATTTTTTTAPDIPKYGTPEYQERAREVAEKQLAPYIKGNVIDVKRVVEAGKIEYLRGLGVEESKIKELQRYALEKGKGKSAEKAEEAILKDYEPIAGDQYISKADWEKLDVKYQKIAKSKGFEAMQKAMEADYKAEVKGALKENLEARFKGDLVAAVKSGIGERTLATAYGEDRAKAAVKAAGPAPKGGWGPKGPTGAETARYAAGLAADVVVPGVYTARHWNELSTGQKAFNIVVDAISLVPFAGAAARGAKGVTAIGRTARLTGAAKGIGQEAIAQVRAPATMVLHPVATVKGAAKAGRDTIENLVHLRKVPEAVITTTNSTVRIPVSELGTEAKANAARNTLMSTLKETGGDVVIDFNGQRFTVTRSALMKEVGGGLAHATPMGDTFAEGLKVAAKPGMPLAEQGLFLSHEPLPRFATSSAFGKTGEKPTILIVGKDIAKDAISSEKIYKGPAGRVAELESKFPVDYTIPKPTQRLYTRIGPDRIKVDILLVNAKLSPAQIAKLKSLAVIEDLRAPFRPAMLVSGKGTAGLTARETAAIKAGLSADEVEELARVLRRSGNADAAASLTRVNRAALATRGGTGRRAARGPAAAEVRIGRPGQRRAERLEIRATGAPRVRVSRDEARATRGKDIEIRRSAPAARREDLPEVREPPRIEVLTRDEILRPGPGREPVTRPDVSRLEVPRPERGRTVDRLDTTRTDSERIERRGEDRRESGEERKARGKLPGGAQSEEWTEKDLRSAVGWKQGAFYWAVREPFGLEDWKAFEAHNVPEGLKISKDQKTAFATIQLYKGKRAPVSITRDLGIVNVHIKRPGRQPGRAGAIRFTPDRSSRRGFDNGLRSKKVGRIFKTKVGRGTVLSATPLGRLRS